MIISSNYSLLKYLLRFYTTKTQDMTCHMWVGFEFQSLLDQPWIEHNFLTLWCYWVVLATIIVWHSRNGIWRRASWTSLYLKPSTITIAITINLVLNNLISTVTSYPPSFSQKNWDIHFVNLSRAPRHLHSFTSSYTCAKTPMCLNPLMHSSSR